MENMNGSLKDISFIKDCLARLGRLVDDDDGGNYALLKTLQQLEKLYKGIEALQLLLGRDSMPTWQVRPAVFLSKVEERLSILEGKDGLSYLRYFFEYLTRETRCQPIKKTAGNDLNIPL